MNLFLIQICIIISHLNLIWTKSYTEEIDEFINKLLSSNKFNELAEKVAEKAARKIFALDQSRISFNIKTRDEDPPNRTRHKSLRDGFGSENFKEKEDKSILGTEIKENPIKFKNEFNRKQTISKNILPSEEQLRLKYKNLKMSRGKTSTKQNVLHTIKDSLKMHKNRIELTKSEPITKANNEIQHKSRFQKVNNQQRSADELKIKNKSVKSSEEMKLHEDNNEEITENRSVSVDYNMKHNADKDSEDKERSNSIRSIHNDMVNDNESNENKYNQNNDSNEGKESHNQTLSVETDNDNPSKGKQISDNLEPKSHSHDDPFETRKDSDVKKLKDKGKSHNMTTRRLIIRREGDKLYAFENSPEYQDYEEKITRQKFESKEILL